VPTAYVLTSETDGATHPVSGETIVGRGERADIRLRDRSVSRRHAALRQDGLTLVVTDLESANGTRVNGEHVVDSTRIEDGDVIAFGSAELRVAADLHEPDEPTPTEINTSVG
jgi:pSer/pThr/pTyr-binding forkhead associated (FHA) protein